MKLNAIPMVMGLLALSVSTAHAGVTHGAGKWAGKGSVFGADGKECGEYQIELVNTVIDEHSIESRGVVTMSNGQAHSFVQRLKDTGEKAFSIESDEGKGGGYSFGDGMIQAYISGAGNQGVAITLAFDGKDTYRGVLTVLENGRAVRFMREKLTRTQ